MEGRRIEAREVMELRRETRVGMMLCKKALEENEGDREAAKLWLREKGIIKGEERSRRKTGEGKVEKWVEGGRVGVIVEIKCESDFVSKGKDFKKLCLEIAEHIGWSEGVKYVSRGEVGVEETINIAERIRKEGGPGIQEKEVHEKLNAAITKLVLEDQVWIKDKSKTVGELIKETRALVGENIVVTRFVRYELGEE